MGRLVPQLQDPSLRFSFTWVSIGEGVDVLRVEMKYYVKSEDRVYGLHCDINQSDLSKNRINEIVGYLTSYVPFDHVMDFTTSE